MGRRACCIVLCVAALAITACDRASDRETVHSERTGSVQWRRCGSVQCATLDVPLDYERPDDEQTTLQLGRLAAGGDRIGVLLVNPGGPGASGMELLPGARRLLPKKVRDRFDIVSWDPRGVGQSSPVRCLDDLDAFYAVDRSPDTAAEQEANVDAARELVQACKQRSGKILPHLSTLSSARDIDAIRAAMGEEQISFLGFSYGSLLGARYADLFPKRVRAMVLDGAIDPARSSEQVAIDQAVGFESNLRRFLDYCRTDGCGFAEGGDPASAFERLRVATDAEPVFANIGGENRILGPGEFDIGVVSALYAGRTNWDALGKALAQAAGGLGNALLAYSDRYTGRNDNGEYSNITAALYAIGCLDAPAPRSVAAVTRLAARAAKASPAFGEASTWLGLPCTFWPVEPEGRPEPIAARGAPPILVVGTRGDPATPYAWAVSLAQQLESGRLLTAPGDQHTAYGRGDDCVDDTINEYLLELAVADGVRCD
jgi:pimeloyl-ACP methyl ester carboxylesterase